MTVPARARRIADLRKLLIIMESDLATMARLAKQAEEALKLWGTAVKPSEIEVAGVALLLHHYYTAAEHTFQSIAQILDLTSYSGEAWHRELLQAMGIALPGVRDRVLAPDTVRYLDELRGFRHVVRHAYEYDLRWERVRALAWNLVKSHALLEQDLQRLVAELERRIAALQQEDMAEGAGFEPASP